MCNVRPQGAKYYNDKTLRTEDIKDGRKVQCIRMRFKPHLVMPTIYILTCVTLHHSAAEILKSEWSEGVD